LGHRAVEIGRRGEVPLRRGMAHARTACRLAKGQTGHAQFGDDLERRVEERLPEPAMMIGPLAAASRTHRHRGRISAAILTSSRFYFHAASTWAGRADSTPPPIPERPAAASAGPGGGCTMQRDEWEQRSRRPGPLMRSAGGGAAWIGTAALAAGLVLATA